MKSNWTGRCPRTLTEALGCTGHAIEVHRTPLTKRFFYALVRHGWWLALVAALLLAGCAGDIDDKRAEAASLHDAIAQAQQSGKWTDEQKRRAKAAAEMVAQGVQP